MSLSVIPILFLISSGIDADGSLLVDGVKVYAGEAHVLKEGEFDR